MPRPRWYKGARTSDLDQIALVGILVGAIVLVVAAVLRGCWW